MMGREKTENKICSFCITDVLLMMCGWMTCQRREKSCVKLMMLNVTHCTPCSVLGDEVYRTGSGCQDCPEEANQCINDRLCCELCVMQC